MITLHVEPQQSPVAWSAFVGDYPTDSIALDGFVDGPTAYDESGPHLNLDHHTGTDRLSTRATCAQALIYVRSGLFEKFQGSDGQPHADIWVNDCDEDVCLSVWIMTHAHLAGEVHFPILNRLVSMIDMLDTTAGVYAFDPELESMQQQAWIFEPYRTFRREGGVGRKDADEFRAIIEEVGRRIEQHIAGIGGSRELDTQFAHTTGGDGWIMVDEAASGVDGRLGIIAAGHRAYVSFRSRSDGRWDYVLGRLSPFVRFPLPAIFDALNTLEGCTNDCWGGGNNIGGSPRVSGSRLSPSALADAINKALANS